MKNCYFVLIKKEGFHLMCTFRAYFSLLPVAEHRHVVQLIDPISEEPIYFASAPTRAKLETEVENYLGKLGVVLIPQPGLY